jgi:hypothetical protein
MTKTEALEILLPELKAVLPCKASFVPGESPDWWQDGYDVSEKASPEEIKKIAGKFASGIASGNEGFKEGNLVFGRLGKWTDSSFLEMDGVAARCAQVDGKLRFDILYRSQ